MKRYELVYSFIGGCKVREVLEFTNWYAAYVKARKIAAYFSDNGRFCLTPLDEAGYTIYGQVKTIGA